MRDFRKSSIWKDSIEVVKLIYNNSFSFPPDELYGLKSQIQRAVVSIPSNIAEGAARKSEKEFSRFLEIALGSAFEVETQLIIAKELDYISTDDFYSILSILNKNQKQINSFISKLKS
jgi:four helix bundle protein